MNDIFIAIPHHAVFRIRSNSSKLTQNLLIKYGSYCYNSFSTSTSNYYEIVIEKHCEHYIIEFNNNTIKCSAPISNISSIIQANRNISPNCFALHGAAIEHNGEAILFLAPTTTGKTTLTCYLVNHKYNYITDDCIIINRESKQVLPVVLPMNLRLGGIEVLSTYGLSFTNLVEIEDRFVYRPTNVTSTPCDIAKIFFITRTSQQNCLKRCTNGESFIKLMYSPIVPYNVNYNYLSFIRELAQIPCYHILFDDFQYIEEMIEKT